jgi:hypothetical protein
VQKQFHLHKKGLDYTYNYDFFHPQSKKPVTDNATDSQKEAFSLLTLKDQASNS